MVHWHAGGATAHRSHAAAPDATGHSKRLQVLETIPKRYTKPPVQCTTLPSAGQGVRVHDQHTGARGWALEGFEGISIRHGTSVSSGSMGAREGGASSGSDTRSTTMREAEAMSAIMMGENALPVHNRKGSDSHSKWRGGEGRGKGRRDSRTDSPTKK